MTKPYHGSPKKRANKPDSPLAGQRFGFAFPLTREAIPLMLG